ncbi:MAG: hypothetical protein KAS32_09760 [Candidatus Peribacteraceae bacterium]|nr:hypothetical protein [Candidatus Peribacteraceae bacterium]
MLEIDEIENLEVEGVDSTDYPDFCDAYFSSGTWMVSGEELTENELDELAQTYPGKVNEMAYESLLG